LRSLNLACCTKVSDETVLAVGKGCPKLRSIKLDQATRLTDKSMWSLVECDRLEVLSIAGCGGITTAPLAAIVEQCQLKYLNIAHCLLVQNKVISEACDTYRGHECLVKRFFDSPATLAHQTSSPPPSPPMSPMPSPRRAIPDGAELTSAGQLELAHQTFDMEMAKLAAALPARLYEYAEGAGSGSEEHWRLPSPQWWEDQDLEGGPPLRIPD